MDVIAVRIPSFKGLEEYCQTTFTLESSILGRLERTIIVLHLDFPDSYQMDDLGALAFAAYRAWMGPSVDWESLGLGYSMLVERQRKRRQMVALIVGAWLARNTWQNRWFTAFYGPGYITGYYTHRVTPSVYFLLPAAVVTAATIAAVRRYA